MPPRSRIFWSFHADFMQIKKLWTRVTIPSIGYISAKEVHQITIPSTGWCVKTVLNNSLFLGFCRQQQKTKMGATAEFCNKYQCESVAGNRLQ